MNQTKNSRIVVHRQQLRVKHRIIARAISEIVSAHQAQTHPIGEVEDCERCRRYQQLRKQLVQNSSSLKELEEGYTDGL
ncbi:hypothetical protein NRIC_22610 [Enterococcus florum]|uniref:Uncharacterized protein n=1 Tax=Enterococcus florum TaxID=2480627 RepID=A0A4P5P908_9ENTE|nr:hypothetical protein [Enterococcus florum]GCF94370.1 hypothetical protein NRIC_22610 [Enterococcus florum]